MCTSHILLDIIFFFLNDTAPTEISPLPLHDALPIYSPAKISEASPLLSTSSSQRGCVSQVISAPGKDSRKAATAGNVCTISPSEPSRTTTNRGSGMRRPAHGFQKLTRGMLLRIPNNRDANPQTCRRGALRDRLRCIIRALGVNVRSQV